MGQPRKVPSYLVEPIVDHVNLWSGLDGARMVAGASAKHVTGAQVTTAG
jgi:hypothetical protein